MSSDRVSHAPRLPSSQTRLVGLLGRDLPLTGKGVWGEPTQLSPVPNVTFWMVRSGVLIPRLVSRSIAPLDSLSKSCEDAPSLGSPRLLGHTVKGGSPKLRLRCWLFDSTAFLTEFRMAMVLGDMDLWLALGISLFSGLVSRERGAGAWAVRGLDVDGWLATLAMVLSRLVGAGIFSELEISSCSICSCSWYCFMSYSSSEASWVSEAKNSSISAR